MSNTLVDQITEVLRAHLKPTTHNHLLSISKRDGGLYTIEEIAAAVFGALGLTEETRSDGVRSGGTVHFPRVVARRYVSPWTYTGNCGGQR